MQRDLHRWPAQSGVLAGRNGSICVDFLCGCLWASRLLCPDPGARTSQGNHRGNGWYRGVGGIADCAHVFLSWTPAADATPDKGAPSTDPAKMGNPTTGVIFEARRTQSQLWSNLVAAHARQVLAPHARAAAVGPVSRVTSVETCYSAAILPLSLPGFSTRTAEYLNSGILPKGSS